MPSKHEVSANSPTLYLNIKDRSQLSLKLSRKWGRASDSTAPCFLPALQAAGLTSLLQQVDDIMSVSVLGGPQQFTVIKVCILHGVCTATPCRECYA